LQKQAFTQFFSDKFISFVSKFFTHWSKH